MRGVMASTSIIRLAAILAAWSTAAWCSADAGLAGRWLGGVDRPMQHGLPDFDLVAMVLTETDGALAVEVRAPDWLEDPGPARVTPEGVEFDIVADGDAATVRLRRDGDTLIGAVLAPTWQAPLGVRQLYPVDAEVMRARDGGFESADGRRIVISGASVPMWSFIFERGVSTQRIGIPSSSTEMVECAAIQRTTDEARRLVFDGPDAFDLLEPGGAATRFERREGYTAAEVEFAATGATIRGTLRLPTGASRAQPRPAVVILPGSGRLSRRALEGDLTVMADWFAQRGFASLVYDRRGVSESDGEYRDLTIDLMASDLEAAIAFLQAHEAIDGGRVGVHGISQAGFYSPRVAAKGSLAFMIIVGSTPVDPIDQDVYWLCAELEACGYPDSEVREAEALQRAKHRYASSRSDDDWAAYSELLASAAQREWADLPNATDSRDDDVWDFWATGDKQDPMADWRAVDGVPILFLWGGADLVSPVELSIQGVNDALRRPGAGPFQCVVIPGAEHSMWASQTGSTREFAGFDRKAPRYFERMGEWLDALAAGWAQE